MKITTKIAVLTFIMGGFAVTVNAQENATATATASAQIIAPIAIEQIADMNFGEIVATTAGGTVVLSAEGIRTEAGVQLPANTGTVSAASFTVTGSEDYAYGVTLPDAGYEIITGEGGENQVMTLTDWTSDTTGVLTGGTETLSVGATLNILPNQAPGAYIGDSPFSVSVVYN
ncbi:DUF4402 domain-containing protein [Anditalea andensis]|uniref:DUF4402 domain-containing protein n=1 Tax=Anditalea andensis TaxID=1048983 RepID=A0A074L5X9_9BACT|nr:DUF4402 domain-containing protein [Anditalea andensis]KEO75910.1 hypothetical protein EL17_23130 [Anditalea andensis]